MITEVIACAAIAVGLFGVVQSASRLVRSARARDKNWQMLGISLVTTGIGMLVLSGKPAAIITAIVAVIFQIVMLLLPKRRST